MPQSAPDIQIADYDYDLPDERIARHPVIDRASAKQLIYSATTKVLRSDAFTNLPDNLPEGTLLIGNQTRVIHARLFFPLGEGKRPIEIFCLHPRIPADYAQNLGAFDQARWECLIGGNRRWKRGKLKRIVPHSDGQITLWAERLDRHDATFSVAFSWQSDAGPVTFGEILEAAGTLPLPPYLRRETEQEDELRYQTVFAREEGSVAAPTAGLHFTPEVIARLQSRGVAWETLTLHVGAGTFRPVSSSTLADHEMHRETFSVHTRLLDLLIEQHQAGKPVLSVGTTTLRCLESLHCIGANLHSGQDPHPNNKFHVNQWAYENPATRELPPLDSLRALRDLMKHRGLTRINGTTEILLSPASGVRVVDGLITNFHQPRSTLLLLIAAIVGDDWQEIYTYALKNDYRFLSYGDSSLLWR